MRILRSYKQAFEFGKEYTGDLEALRNTLNYIFNDLHYSCYMLCVKDHKPCLYKLESLTGNPRMDRTINKTLRQKNIKSRIKTWRVMQCVVKPFKKAPTFAKEWVTFLDKLSGLPDGVFILSLSDSVLLPESKEGQFLPVFAYSGKRGYKDIPIPTYDDIFDNNIGIPETNWNLKKSVAVFRGSTTGCGTTAQTNMRIKLATMKSDDLDVGITKYTENLKLDPILGLSKVEKSVPLVKPLTMEEQSRYKYMIHIDGNVGAYRLLKTMLTGSLILRVKSDYVMWSDSYLKAGKHYIEVKEDLSDLNSVLDWCKNHDVKAKTIAEEGTKMAKMLLDKSFIEKAFVGLLSSSL